MAGRRSAAARCMTARRLAKRRGDASTLSLGTPKSWPRRLLARCPRAWQSDGSKARLLRARAASCSFCSSRGAVVLVSASTAMRRSPGTPSIRISCRLPSSSVARMLTPVVLPPGRASERTSPDPTISSVNPRIGIVAVARCAARIAASPPQKRTSTRDLTSSAAIPVTARRPPVWPRQSIVRFWPSMKPTAEARQTSR